MNEGDLETYSIRLHASARSYLARLSRPRQIQVWSRLEQLRLDPLDPQLSKPLHGRADQRRSSRIGDLRIVFRVLVEAHIVDITDIGPRGDIYKQ